MQTGLVSCLAVSHVSLLPQPDGDVSALPVLVFLQELPLFLRPGPQRGRDEVRLLRLPVLQQHRGERHQQPAGFHTHGDP